MQYLNWDVVAQVAALAFVVVVLGAAASTEKGRQALAQVGIGLAVLALKVAEKSAGKAQDPSRAERARGAMGKLKR